MDCPPARPVRSGDWPSPAYLPQMSEEPQQQGRQADGEHDGFDVFDRMVGEIAFEEGRAQRSAMDQGVKCGRPRMPQRMGDLVIAWVKLAILVTDEFL